VLPLLPKPVAFYFFLSGVPRFFPPKNGGHTQGFIFMLKPRVVDAAKVSNHTKRWKMPMVYSTFLIVLSKKKKVPDVSPNVLFSTTALSLFIFSSRW
jgi:hypothetical protein